MTKRLILLLVGCLMLAACSGVPERSDAVVVGPPPAGGDQSEMGNGIQPGGPERDATSDQIVRGFIKALTATDSSYSVARQFLTPDADKKWSPSESVTVIAPSIGATPGGTEGTVRFTANREARVDTSGVFHVDRGSIDITFEVKQVNGQWRINNPPSELIVDSESFASLYKNTSIYFADPSGSKLVADVRYFRNNPQQRANRLIQALIDGPVSTLANGVRNELAAPVKLRTAVSYKQDPITVDLSGLGQKSEAQLRIASAQILWTLYGDLNVQSARITNDGGPLEITGVGEIQGYKDWDNLDPNAFPFNASAYYLDGGAILTDTTAKVPGPVGTGEYGITDAAISIDGTRVAAVSGGASPPVLRTGGINEMLAVVDLPGTTTLTRPTWGPSSDEFWIVSNGTEVVRVPVKGAPKIINSQSLANIGPIRRLTRSRDGTRVAIIAGAPGGPGQLYLATVQQTPTS